jgi:hypothetical protein
MASPTTYRLVADPFGPHPASVYRLSFSGTYTAGGLDLTPGQFSTGALYFALISDTAQFRFYYDIPNRKLRVYTGGGAEASGSITFDTSGLFIGSAR